MLARFLLVCRYLRLLLQSLISFSSTSATPGLKKRITRRTNSFCRSSGGLGALLDGCYEMIMHVVVSASTPCSCSNDEIMPPRQVLVTYTAHPPGSAHIRQAINAINGHLPLRNLHWKPSNRTSLRTIQELDVRLVELGDAAGGAQGIGASLLERPLVNLCLVVCEVRHRSLIREVID